MTNPTACADDDELEEDELDELELDEDDDIDEELSLDDELDDELSLDDDELDELDDDDELDELDDEDELENVPCTRMFRDAADTAWPSSGSYRSHIPRGPSVVGVVSGANGWNPPPTIRS